MLLAVISQASAWTLVSDNGTDHQYYDIIGAPWGRVRVPAVSSGSGVGHLSLPLIGAPVGTRCLKIRAASDDATSQWVRWCYSRDSFDGNFTYDNGNGTITTVDADDGPRYGLSMGAH